MVSRYDVGREFDVWRRHRHSSGKPSTAVERQCSNQSRRPSVAFSLHAQRRDMVACLLACGGCTISFFKGSLTRD